MVEIRLFEPADLEGVLRLCVAEGWPSFPSDPDRARRVLTAPGVTTVVAVDGGVVVGGGVVVVVFGGVVVVFGLVVVPVPVVPPPVVPPR